MPYIPINLTEAGLALQGKALLGEAIVFTKLKVGAGVLPDGTTIDELNDLVDPIATLGITQYQRVSATSVLVGGYFSNNDIGTAFHYREIGLFADDPDEGEILYGYGAAVGNPDYIPATSTGQAIEKSIAVEVVVGATENVTAVFTANTELAEWLQVHDIPESADLNNYIQPGWYRSATAAITATLSNIPSGLTGAFFLYVGQHDYTPQILYSNSTTAPKQFNRNKGGSGWGAWDQLYSTLNPPPVVASVLGGSGSFSGSTVTGTTITHGHGAIAAAAYAVSITPSAAGGGNLGEYYVVKAADGTFTVYNTGTATTSFDWMAVKVS
jgi:hypothetical protein